jgi:hypothetical protein
MAFLTQNKAKLCTTLIITLVIEKNANFFRRKLSKIAENCDHNIDPRSQCYVFVNIFAQTRAEMLAILTPNSQVR